MSLWSVYSLQYSTLTLRRSFYSMLETAKDMITPKEEDIILRALVSNMVMPSHVWNSIKEDALRNVK